MSVYSYISFPVFTHATATSFLPYMAFFYFHWKTNEIIEYVVVDKNLNMYKANLKVALLKKKSLCYYIEVIYSSELLMIHIHWPCIYVRSFNLSNI